MRVLLVDNSKPAIRVHTPKLVQMLERLRAEVTTCETTAEVSRALEPTTRHTWDAVVLSGSSLNMSESLKTSRISKDLMTLLQMQDVAVLGVCFGMQLLAVVNGGTVGRLTGPCDGDARVTFTTDTILGSPRQTRWAYFHHQDVVTEAPPTFVVDGHRAEDGIVASFHSRQRHRFGVQFHPEESADECGLQLVERFLRVAHSGRVVLSPEVRISRDTFARVALQMGRCGVHQVADAYGLDAQMVVCVWNMFRRMYRVPALLN